MLLLQTNVAEQEFSNCQDGQSCHIKTDNFQSPTATYVGGLLFYGWFWTQI